MGRFRVACLLTVTGVVAAVSMAHGSAGGVRVSSGPAQRATAVSEPVSLLGMEPLVLIVGQPTEVTVHGHAFSEGTQVKVAAGGFEVAAENVQFITPELLVGEVVLPDAATGAVGLNVRRPDGATASLPAAAQAQEVFWGLRTDDGVVVSGRLGSGVPIWIGTESESQPAPRAPERARSDAISDCQRISFCTIPSGGLGDFRPSVVSPNKCNSVEGEYPATNGITYFFCSSGPCTPTSQFLIKDKAVALKAFPRYWTGGHCHSQPNRPNGSPDSVQGNTGPTGLGFSVNHTWPDIAGAVNVVVYSTDASWQFNTQRDTNYVYCVKEPDLVQLGQEVGFILVGDKPWHPSNHYARMAMIEDLRRLAQDVQSRLPSALPLVFNDMSLISGGLFDIKQDWSKSHCSHRNGMNVDLGIKQMGGDHAGREYLEAICKSRGFDVSEEDSAKTNWHWHLTYKNPPKEAK